MFPTPPKLFGWIQLDKKWFYNLLQSLPIYLKPKEKKRINYLYCTFIWNGRCSRLSFHMLTQPKLTRGMNFPKLRLYNLASILRVVHDWLQSTSVD